ncbi:MAG: phosphate ABC transporter substrate-binding protein PstS, partial [Actinomycetales bacterium]|nr:phosphate ABC transporter substrate-binding protein PstS [Actinomycetales bacterium]
MKLNRTKTAGAALFAGALALTLAACGSSNAPASTPDASESASETSAATETETEASTTLSGNLAGAGASSQEKAMGGWIAGFGDSHPDVLVSYDPVGSGGGREQFLSGATL